MIRASAALATLLTARLVEADDQARRPSPPDRPAGCSIRTWGAGSARFAGAGPARDGGDAHEHRSLFTDPLKEIGFGVLAQGLGQLEIAVGARAAGMTGVLLDRAGSVPHPDGPTVRSLDELLDLIAATAEVAA